MRKIYLDYAAATPMRKEVLEAMKPYFTDKFYNASATYLAARDIRQELNELRHKTAGIIGARPAEIIFTSGASEANNLALKGVKQLFPAGEILVSAIEHDSALKPALKLGAKIIPVTEQGIVDLARLEKMVNDKTVLVSVMYVNNELGTIQPLKEIAKILDESSISRKTNANQLPLYFHSDAAQAANYLDTHVARLGVDMMSLNGGKVYGPKGAGLLYAKAGTKLAPLVEGGGQEFGIRSGTENMANIAGMSSALELAAQSRAAESHRIAGLRQEFEKLLLKNIPQAVINGSAKHRLPHITSLTIEGIDNERVMMELDERGIECAVGSACSASSDQPSHVLTAIGLSEAQARATLRFSFGRFTTVQDIAKTADTLAALVANNR